VSKRRRTPLNAELSGTYDVWAQDCKERRSTLNEDHSHLPSLSSPHYSSCSKFFYLLRDDEWPTYIIMMKPSSVPLSVSAMPTYSKS